MNESFNVFLSYNSKDKPTVRQLAQVLQARGLKVWLDEEQLVPGRPWQDALERIIQTAHTAAVLVGKDGFGPWEIPEMRACLSEFVNRNLPVIPVLLPGAPIKPELPLFLRAFTWVDLRAGLTDDGLSLLEWGITGIKPGQSTESTKDRLPPPQPTPPIQIIHGWSDKQVKELQQQTAEALKIQQVEFHDFLKDGSPGPMMVVIPAGRFLMGSPENEPNRINNERQHEVEVGVFAISKYTVTFEEYDRFAKATRRENPSDVGWGRGQRPVVNITWFDGIAYTAWLSEQTNQAYRLPTEAEWEYACRAGTTTPYHFGTTINIGLAHYCDGSFLKSILAALFTGKTVEVGQYSPNAWSLHDMHGNVWEWTCSAYDPNYDSNEQRCVGSADTDSTRVLRGGSWFTTSRWVRCATRTKGTPDIKDNSWGFRLVRALAF